MLTREMLGAKPLNRFIYCAELPSLATDLLAHLAFEEAALGPTLLELEEWPY